MVNICFQILLGKLPSTIRGNEEAFSVAIMAIGACMVQSRISQENLYRLEAEVDRVINYVSSVEKSLRDLRGGVNLRPNTRLVPVLPNRCAVLEGGRTTKEVLEREARRAWDTLAKEKVGDPRLPVLDKAMVNFSLYTWWKLP